MPTSSTAISTPTLAKYSNAITVSISKKLGCQGSLPAMHQMLRRQLDAVVNLAELDVGDSSLFTRMRSLMRTRCGEL